MKIQKIRFTYAQIISLGFLATILLGSLLLRLPSASAEGVSVPYMDALFTATSATCITGLVVADTYTNWSLFGQIVILVLIQVGGLGFMTVITMFSLLTRRKISIHQRKILMQSAGSIEMGGIVKLIKKILLGTLIFEGFGVILCSVKFYGEMGFAESVFNGIFHSVSSFCNAGFDLFGKFSPYSSLTHYRNDWLINLVTIFLIVVGGLGFLVWNDIMEKGFKIKDYELHTKLVLTVTAILIFAGTVLFYIFEGNNVLYGFSPSEKILVSLFQSVSPRTAGFNTVDMGKLSDSGSILTDFLMFIGGSPGSTAGGIKTTTLAVLVLGAVSASRHTKHITIFKRRLDESAIKQASAIFMIYMAASIAAVMIICHLEPFSMKAVIFEVVSAIGTVGLSTGITPLLGGFSRVVLIVLMYGGRVGGLTLMLSLAEKKVVTPVERPVEKILIG